MSAIMFIEWLYEYLMPLSWWVWSLLLHTTITGIYRQLIVAGIHVHECYAWCSLSIVCMNTWYGITLPVLTILGGYGSSCCILQQQAFINDSVLTEIELQHS